MILSRILITGAGGFAGTHLVAELRRRFPQAALHTEPFDVTDPDAVTDAMTSARPDACLHLAAISSVPESRRDARRAFAVNLGGTLNLALSILDHVPQCRMIHVGSADCYGVSFKAGVPLDETAPLAPLNVYAASKAAADMALGSLAAEGGLRVLRFRPFNHTGPGQSANFALPAFAAQIARIRAGAQEPVIRVGNLDPERDFLDVRDVVRAYALALERFDELPPGMVLNLASGTPRRIGDILNMMISTSGLDIRIEPDPDRLRPVEIPSASGDASAARAALGWRPEIPFEATLKSLAEDFSAG